MKLFTALVMVASTGLTLHTTHEDINGRFKRSEETVSNDTIVEDPVSTNSDKPLDTTSSTTTIIPETVVETSTALDETSLKMNDTFSSTTTNTVMKTEANTTAVTLLISTAAPETPKVLRALSDKACDAGRWDDNADFHAIERCRYFCNCAEGIPCNDFTGVCAKPTSAQQPRCADGFEGDRCDEPTCYVDCGPAGVCVHKNHCVCTDMYTRETEEIVHTETKESIIVHRCRSLRMDGLKGALVSLVVLIIAISFCGCMQWSTQKSQRSYACVDEN